MPNNAVATFLPAVLMLAILASKLASGYVHHQMDATEFNENGFRIFSRPAKGQDKRVKFLILHFTVSDRQRSIELLVDGGNVSSHYLICQEVINGELIYQLVDENDRAWHAGVSAWGIRTNLNDVSIGIENVNGGYEVYGNGTPKLDENGNHIWYPWDSAIQIEALIQVSKRAIKRFGIPARNVLGHGDVAPTRRVDPGPLFPWKTLYENGIGAWPDEEDVTWFLNAANPDEPMRSADDIEELQNDLREWGYKLDVTGQLDQQTGIIVNAFHMHYLSREGKEPTAQTRAVLKALLKKYPK